MVFLIKLFSFLSLLFLISCGGGGGGSSSSSSSASSSHFNGYTASYNSSTADSWTSNNEFDGVLYTGSISGRTTSQNPYEVMNIHKAYGYGLSGDDYYIHVQDDRIDQNHMEFSGKTISNYQSNYSTDVNSNASGSNWHGAAVSSVALGAYNNNSKDDIMGVAYNADLYYSDYDTLASGVSDYARDYALALDGAPNNTAASNHSYGVVGTNIQTVIDYKNNNNVSNAYTVAAYLTAAGLSSSTSNAQKWLDSLNSFQSNKGVIVWSLSNTTSHTEAHWMAGLPELETSLNDAWVTVGTVDIQGSLGNESYTAVYSDCGSTAAYCVVTDSFGVNFASYESALGSGIDEDGSSSSYSAGTGNSFGAPMVSGSITLLNEAFPNLTPAQITDRLLATANNTFFTRTAVVDFGNGVKHAYNSEFGHGIPDLYKALQPITSSMLGKSILVGEKLNQRVAYNLENSIFLAPRVFGDSLSRHFSNKNAVFHDALYGNFDYNFSNSFISSQNTFTSDQKLENHFNQYSFQRFTQNNSQYIQPKDFIFKKQMIDGQMKIDSSGFSNFTNFNGVEVYNSINIPVEISSGFVSTSNSKDLILKDGFKNPFIPSNTLAIGSSFFENNNDFILSFYDDSINNPESTRSGLTLTKSVISNDKANSSIMFGFNNEQNAILGAKTYGAFDQNKHSPTLFFSHSFEKKINEDTDFSIISSIGRTQFDNYDNQTLINHISPIISSSFGIVIGHEINNSENFRLTLSQPHRLERGHAKILIPQNTSIDGTLNYESEKVSLTPSGRQIDLSLRYNKSIIQDSLLFSFENIITRNEGHISSNGVDITGIASLNYSF